MAGEMNRKLVLENGEEYLGWGFGAACDRVCEVTFATAVVGYQELVTNPALTDQMVVMTYPLIGNYGMTEEDDESGRPSLGALVVRDYCDTPSNFRCTRTLSEVLEQAGVPGICGVDTRAITRSIRDHGGSKALLCHASMPTEQALELLRQTSLSLGRVAKVSCKKPRYVRTANPRFHVVALDCGIQQSLVSQLKENGCNVTIVPWNTEASAIEALKPHGLLVSDGPGDPNQVSLIAETLAKLRGKFPIFGLGLGCQLIAMSYGTAVSPVAFRRITSHPIRCLETKAITIASQNLCYTIDPKTLEGKGLTVTYENVLDGTVEGLMDPSSHVSGVQFYPEGQLLLARFLNEMKEAN